MGSLNVLIRLWWKWFSDASKDLQLFLQILYLPKCLRETLGPNTKSGCVNASVKFE